MQTHHCTPVCQSFPTTFCPRCGAANKERLNGIQLLGFVGVAHSTSPAIERFFATGDPDAL